MEVAGEWDPIVDLRAGERSSSVIGIEGEIHRIAVYSWETRKVQEKHGRRPDALRIGVSSRTRASASDTERAIG